MALKVLHAVPRVHEAVEPVLERLRACRSPGKVDVAAASRLICGGAVRFTGEGECHPIASRRRSLHRDTLQGMRAARP